MTDAERNVECPVEKRNERNERNPRLLTKNEEERGTTTRSSGNFAGVSIRGKLSRGYFSSSHWLNYSNY